MNDECAAFFDEAFRDRRFMAVLRGHTPDEAVYLAHRAWDVGVALVEVTIQSEDALPALRAVVAAGAERGQPVGAGTVTRPEQVDLVADAGGAFTVAPGFDDDVVRGCVAAGLPHLPGVATATEIQRATRSGFRWLKAFPSAVLGAGWFTAQRGPFPSVRFVATGGLDARTCEPFFAAGVDVVGVGSALRDLDQLKLIEAAARRPAAS